jgi:ubiquinone/menaquinone biosynthesis C-methylase UbiE
VKPIMDEYTRKTKDWLDERFKRCDKDGIYYAHQPIYGMRKGYSESGLINRYIITFRIMEALSHLKFDSLVDIGGAEGYKAWVAKQIFGVKVKNSDLSEEACKRCQEIFGIESIPIDIHELPFKDNEFDVALCSETLEHVLDLPRAVSELLRVSRKAVIITVPHESRETVDKIKRVEVPHGHIHSFDLGSFDFLKSKGFRVLPRKMVSPALKKMFLHHLGKRAASLQIHAHDLACGLSSNYNAIIFVILKNDGYWMEKPVRRVSVYQILNFAVPFHYPNKCAPLKS